MAGPDYGALGATFKVTRALQAVSMIAIIGMTANFIAEMVSSNVAPPNVLIGTLSVVSHKKPAPSFMRCGTDDLVRSALRSSTALLRSFFSSITSSRF